MPPTDYFRDIIEVRMAWDEVLASFLEEKISELKLEANLSKTSEG